MKQKTYIYSAKYVIKAPHVIWRTAKGLEDPQPLWTEHSAARRQLGGEVGYVINPAKKRNTGEGNKRQVLTQDKLNQHTTSASANMGFSS